MSEFTPNQEAVRRISAHLLGEDMRNVKAAVESFPNGYTVVPPSESTQVDESSSEPSTAAGRRLHARIFGLSDRMPDGAELDNLILAIEAEARAASVDPNVSDSVTTEPASAQAVARGLDYSATWREFEAYEDRAAKQGCGMSRDQMTGASMMLSWLCNRDKAAAYAEADREAGE